ncbi:MAG: S41 family peptidase [Bacteroidota bacterium]
MKHWIILVLALVLTLPTIQATAQSTFDAPFAIAQMKADLQLFYDIRAAANSGVYKYRSQVEIDSVYQWAFDKIEQSATLGDFYKIILQITDFEGSLHNDTELPAEVSKNISKEDAGYFPFAIKQVAGKWVCNNADKEIPTGAEILSINDVPISTIIRDLRKYYTTDGFNITGKQIGLKVYFPLFFRYEYGPQDSFRVEHVADPAGGARAIKTLQGISHGAFLRNLGIIHSMPIDKYLFLDAEELAERGELYYTEMINDSTAMLVVNDFAIGANAKDKKHKAYVAFLEAVFRTFRRENIQHLIVDVRHNGGGTNPNNLVTYSYLTNRAFQENVAAWISFRKIPFWKEVVKDDFFFLARPFVKGIYQRRLKKEFSIVQAGGYFQNDKADDQQIWMSNENAFQGQIYLLIGPRVASAGSLFASMLASDESTITIGEETMGGYYGHNGHTPFTYELSHSKIRTSFSIVNLKQDVETRPDQPFGYGVIPDHRIVQSLGDFLENRDTVLVYAKQLIAAKH